MEKFDSLRSTKIVIQGIINGIDYSVARKITGEERAETGILTVDGQTDQSYYLIGIPRDILSKLFLRRVQVGGELYENAGVILVESIAAVEGVRSDKVWEHHHRTGRRNSFTPIVLQKLLEASYLSAPIM